MLRREPARISDRRAGANLLRFYCINRKQQFYSALLREIENFARQIDLVRFNAARANRDPLGLKKCVRHRTADQKRVGFFHQRFQNADLIGNLRSA